MRFVHEGAVQEENRCRTMSEGGLAIFSGNLDSKNAGSPDSRPDVKSFRQFLTECARVKGEGGEYENYSFKGREAFIEIVDLIDRVLGIYDLRLPIADLKNGGELNGPTPHPGPLPSLRRERRGRSCSSVRAKWRSRVRECELGSAH